MNNKKTSLYSTFSVNGELTDGDTRFLSVTIDVLHDGTNLNESNFSKDVVNSCIDSISNTPVLGFIKYDDTMQEYDFRGHEYVLTKNEDGVEQKYIGSAYGIIPESCNPRWVTKLCPDGEERDFLQVDALLWTKFSDCTDIMNRDAEKSQSMELELSSIEGDEDDNGIFYFSKFKFDGCCILGSDVQPAMTGANVKVNDVQFSKSDFIENIQKELNDKFETFSILVNEQNKQGGVRNMSKTMNDFSQTVLSQIEDISNIVSTYETMENSWGEPVARFWLTDIQDDEIIVVDRKDNYNYYGFPFAFNGDKPEIDFACGGKRKKVRYEDYEDGPEKIEGSFDFGEHIASIESEAANKLAEIEIKFEEAEKKIEEAESNYNSMKEEYDVIKPKYDEYVLAEEKREADELNASKDAKFAEYESVLSDSEEFMALKEKKGEMSIDDIEKECAVLFFKASRSKNSFSKKDCGNVVAGVFSSDDDVADGYVQTKYGNIHVGR